MLGNWEKWHVCFECGGAFYDYYEIRIMALGFDILLMPLDHMVHNSGSGIQGQADHSCRYHCSIRYLMCVTWASLQLTSECMSLTWPGFGQQPMNEYGLKRKATIVLYAKAGQRPNVTQIGWFTSQPASKMSFYPDSPVKFSDGCLVCGKYFRQLIRF